MVINHAMGMAPFSRPCGMILQPNWLSERNLLFKDFT
jgi:hypothetical protein